nr:PEPxxWA-CTERM sorting domain-containing protein [Sandaracinobacteroides hominis]
MRKHLIGAAFAALASASLFATPASAATLVIDVSGIDSYGGFGDPSNVLLSYDLGAFAHITGISYDVTLTAFSPSWLSEMVLAFTSSSFDGWVELTPAFVDEDPGTGSYSGSGDLVALGLDFKLDGDGLLNLEFFESFDDPFISPDGLWNSGTVTITYAPAVDPNVVPEPATWVMLIAGFGLIGTAARRRRNAAA